MIKKTDNYQEFKYRDDNREIKNKHVHDLAKSIKEKNYLELFPIIVNEKMEVIDGQHRLKAAELAEVPIYYRVVADWQPSDMLRINSNSKTWKSEDVLNFYSEHGYKEYIKFKRFMQEKGIGFSTALALTLGKGGDLFKSFREGKFVFPEHVQDYDFEIYKDTFETLKLVKGNTAPFRNKRFTSAFFRFTAREDFDGARWLKNVTRLASRFVPCVSQGEYEDMFLHIYNYGYRKS